MTARLQAVEDGDPSTDTEFQRFLTARQEALQALQESRGGQAQREAFLAVYGTFADVISRKLLETIASNAPSHPSALPSPELQQVLDVCYAHRAPEVPHGWIAPDNYRTPTDHRFVM